MVVVGGVVVVVRCRLPDGLASAMRPTDIYCVLCPSLEAVSSTSLPFFIPAGGPIIALYFVFTFSYFLSGTQLTFSSHMLPSH